MFDGKFIVGVDIDETINDLTSVFLQVYHELTGHKIYYECLREYNLKHVIPEENHHLIEQIFGDETTWKRVSPVADAQHYLPLIHDMDNTDVYYVTCARCHNFAYKMEFLQQYYPFITYDKVIVCHTKQLLGRMDVLIDDCLYNFTNASYLGLVPKRPWNKEYSSMSWQHVTSWDEIYRLVDIMRKETISKERTSISI